MSPLDHLPIPNLDLEGACLAFQALGFTVTPPCVYTSPEQPDAEWRNRSVFLAEGWLDLQAAPGAPAGADGAPASCLFRTGDLHAARAAFSDMRQTEPYSLIRTWPDAPELGAERFALFSIMERISPLVARMVRTPEYRPESKRPRVSRRPARRRRRGGGLPAGPLRLSLSRRG